MAFTTKDGQVVRDTSINAPTYNDPFFDFMGETYQNAFATDPALAMTLSAGGQGGMSHGVGAFLNPNAAYAFNNTGKEGTSSYDTSQMQELAKQFGYDISSYTDPGQLEGYLNSQLKDYYGISGLSAGWNPSGDARQANNTLYKRENGKLVPYGTQGYSAPEKGSWLAENPEALYVLGVAGAGAGALAAGYGAGLGGGAGAATGGGAAAGGTAGAAGGSSLGSLASGLQGWYAGLPGWGQGALTGAAQGGISSGIQGKNILSGALMGGLTGGVGAYAGGALSAATGMPAWASKGLVSAGLGGLQGGWQGALGAGLGSLASTGLGELGLNGQLAGKLGGLAGNYAAGSILGGAQGGSGGVGSGVGMLGASGTAGTAGTGLAGAGMTPRLGAASAQEKAWMNTAYAPIAIEAQKKKIAQQVREEGLEGLA